MDASLCQRELDWVHRQNERAKAMALLRYARMINTLDSSLCRGMLASGVTLRSQFVREELHGEEQVQVYFDEETQRLRANVDRTFKRIELSHAFMVGPCGLAYRPLGPEDRSFSEFPRDMVTIKVNVEGQVTQIFEGSGPVYVAEWKHTGIFPGLSPVEVWPIRPPLPWPSDFSELRLVLCLINGITDLDLMMKVRCERVARNLPGAVFETETSDSLSMNRPEDMCAWEVSSFPTLIVLWKDDYLSRIAGLTEEEAILDRIRSMFT